jgi:cephalosporin hydroxylase
MITLDASHELRGMLTELALYAPLVSVGSYLVVQDARLDKIWGKPAIYAAVTFFLGAFDGDFEWDATLPFHGCTQHMYLKRVGDTALGSFNTKARWTSGKVQ